MKKLITGVALVAVMAGCLFVGGNANSSKAVGDRSGGLIADRSGVHIC